MNYKRIYYQLISRAKNRAKPDCYCEKHHIILKSLGGGDNKSNIAVLTAREHFIAHWLLKKIHNNKQTIYAFHCMTKPVGNGIARYNSHSFKYAKEAMASYMTEHRSGKNHPFYGLKGKDHPHFGMKRSEETKSKLSKKAKLRDRTKNPMAKPIVCIETGEVFQSISIARDKYKKGNINYALKSGGTADGLHFRYKDGNYNNALKGYSRGIQHPNTRLISDFFGNTYSTLGDAGNSVGATGPAVRAAIKNNRECKGVLFHYV